MGTLVIQGTDNGKSYQFPSVTSEINVNVLGHNKFNWMAKVSHKKIIILDSHLW